MFVWALVAMMAISIAALTVILVRTRRRLGDEIGVLSAELRETDRQRARADDRLQHALLHANVEMWERDMDTDEAWSSGAWAHGADSITEEFRRRIDPDDVPLFDGFGASHLVGDQEREFRFRVADDSYRWMLARSALVERDGSRVVFGVQMDVTDRHVAHEELNRLNRLLKDSNDSLVEFVRVASHDLRSPMRGIATLCNFIWDDGGDVLPDGITSHVRRIEERIARLLTLLDDLLAFASSGDEAVAVEVNLAATVDGIADDLRCDNGPAIRTDAEDLDVALVPIPFSTCLRNLVDNACKYHDRPLDGSVDIGVKVEGGTVVASVTDDGPGIAAEDLRGVFEPFRRAAGSSGTIGSGLGLSVVARMAEQFGATVEVESEPGVGTVFTITWSIVGPGDREPEPQRSVIVS